MHQNIFASFAFIMIKSIELSNQKEALNAFFIFKKLKSLFNAKR